MEPQTKTLSSQLCTQCSVHQARLGIFPQPSLRQQILLWSHTDCRRKLYAFHQSSESIKPRLQAYFREHARRIRPALVSAGPRGGRQQRIRGGSPHRETDPRQTLLEAPRNSPTLLEFEWS